MRKISTRTKRKFRLSTHLSHYNFFHPRLSKHRPKTFKTEEAAHAWASGQDLKKEQYHLKKAKRNSKFQVVITNG